MKYIILSVQGVELAIVFPDPICHSQAVNLTEAAPVSAGFCSLRNGKVSVHGESVSLSLKPRRQDPDIIESTLLLNGMLPINSHDAAAKVIESYLLCPPAPMPGSI